MLHFTHLLYPIYQAFVIWFKSFELKTPLICFYLIKYFNLVAYSSQSLEMVNLKMRQYACLLFFLYNYNIPVYLC